jgi:hypothetical protein
MPYALIRKLFCYKHGIEEYFKILMQIKYFVKLDWYLLIPFIES